jgi:sugar phosphate isomerase/epimerase
MSFQSAEIGAKLPLQWRSSGDLSDILPSRAPYIHLSDLGFDYLEFGVGGMESGDDRELLREETLRCRAAGLGLSLHPYLSGPAKIARFERGPECRQALDRLLGAAADAAENLDGQVTMVFHPAEETYDPAVRSAQEMRKELLRISRRFASALQRRLKGIRARVSAALEHQVPPTPEEYLIRTGDTAEELLRVVAETDLPLCWDTGHYLLAVERHDQPVSPPPEFRGRVAHLHLHDVVEGRDHRPLTEGSRQIRLWIERLLDNGFSGRMTLEYEPDAVAEYGGLDRVARRSLRLLRHWGV